MTEPEATPDWLTTALASHRATPVADRSTSIDDLGPGDLWVFERPNPSEAEPVRRVGLVLDVDLPAIHIALVSNEVEWASERDVVFTADEARTPYSLMVQTPAHARVSSTWAVERVGYIDDELLYGFLDLLHGTPSEALGLRRGRPYARSAEREDFERLELSHLRRLATGCDPTFGPIDPVPYLVDVAAIAAGHVSLESFPHVARAVDTGAAVICHGMQDYEVGLPEEVREKIGRDLLGVVANRVVMQFLSNNPGNRAEVEIDGVVRTLLCTPLPPSVAGLRFMVPEGSNDLLGRMGDVPIFACEGRADA